MAEKRVAFFTTVYPAAMPFFADFLQSLEVQTYSDFEVVVCNDGVEDLEDVLKNYSLICRCITLAARKTPGQIREMGLSFIKKEGYEIVINGDADDFFEINRVENAVKHLEYHDIVINDIALVDKKGSMYMDHYIGRSLADGSVITAPYFWDKNVFGMSNSSFKTEVFALGYEVPRDLVAYDWNLVYRLVQQSSSGAYFTAETSSYYRQYDSNTVGMGERSPQQIESDLKVLQAHYSALKELAPSQEHEIKDKLQNIEILGSDPSKTELIKAILKQYPHEFPLWWEEANAVLKHFKNQI